MEQHKHNYIVCIWIWSFVNSAMNEREITKNCNIENGLYYFIFFFFLFLSPTQYRHVLH